MLGLKLVTMKNYFEILGVNENASDEDIKKAYRSMAMKHHPDRTGGDDARFKEIQEAYSVLSDPAKRAEWNHMRSGGFHGFQQGAPGGFHFSWGPGGGGINIDEIFRNFNDPFGGFAKPQRKNKDLRVSIDLDLEETLEKQTKHISVKHLNGTRQTVSVDIPRGIGANMQMKYAHYGDHSYQDLPPGDLYIDFRIRVKPGFIVEGLDLIKPIKLNCLDAITGTTVPIEGIDGKKFDWSVPAGTQHGTKFRIANEGLWAMDHPVRGSLIVYVEVSVPMNLSRSQIEIIKNISKELN